MAMAEQQKMKVLEITAGEKLLIERNRHKETQAQAAKRGGIKRIHYGKLERDIGRENIRDIKMLLFDYERCVIFRIRRNISQIELARKLGCSRYTINKIENDKTKATRLINFWESNSDA